ncbi:gliding motility-associated-like protein [Algoriphagus aquaeductus]|uniref:Gliding motility-associated-like protein n=1 Tax=Algoriphagus aquaeductus TaxID=475299 RepID=A0A326RRK5_9BACT|nr:PKD domain-containing protein [Algoriphagus aquaeductus]PZV76091.1 gliding motility-associated-like protein [Algoriphagus aquaeductus]
MRNFSLPKIAILALFLTFIVGITIGSFQGFAPSLQAILYSQNEAPTADFTFSPNNVCANEPIKFTNTSTGTDLTYSWNFGDGSPISNLKDPTHTFNAVGGGTKTFTVTLTVTENGISANTSKQVQIKETPDLKVGSDQNSKDFEGLPYFVSCTNQDTEFLFLNQSTTKSTNKKYTIDWGDGSPLFISTEWASEKHFYKRGIYQVTYTIESANGCSVTRKFGVFVGSNPAVGLATPGNTNICTGEPLTFTVTGTENNPVGTIYKVSFSDGTPDQVFTHPPPATVTHIYEKTSCGALSNSTFKNYFAVKILATNPCESSVAQVEPIYVTEPVEPEIKVPQAPVCVDQPTIIENISDLFVDASNSGSCSDTGKFVWEISPATGWTLASNALGDRPIATNPNTWSSGSKIINPVFQTPGTYTIKLITGNKCGLEETTKTICVIPKPISSFTLEKTEVCGPATIKATNTSNILGACGSTNTNTFTWSVAYTKGTCGTTSDWEFAGGSNKNSESPSFLFKNPGIYTIRLTIAASCGSVFKEEKITVTAPPTVSINSIPNSCGPATITPKATVGVCDSGTPTYKWTFEGGVPATSSSLDPGPVTFSTPGPKKITLEVISSCGSTTTEKIFTINELPVANAGPDAEICNGEEIKLTGIASGGTGPYTYQWTSTPTSTITGANTATPTVKPNQTTVYKLTVRDQATNCISTDEVEIKVIPAPIIQFDIPNQEICSGETTKAVNLTTIPSGETFTWTSAANGAVGVTPSGTVQIPAETLTNTTGKPIDVVYTALISNSSQGNCTVVPAKYIIRVNPAPVYTNENLSICSDQSFDFKPANNITGSTFTWTVAAPSGISGASNSIQAATSIKQQLQNTTNAPLDIIYTITPFLGSCSGNSFELKVTVQPAPSIIFSESDQTLCTGGTSKMVVFTSDVAGASFSWAVNPKGVAGVLASGTGNQLPAQTLTNPTNQPITLEFQVSVSTSSGGTCSGVPKTYRITVNPSITITDEVSNFNGFGISCSGANDGFIKLNPSGGNGIFIYSWTGPAGFNSSSKDLSNLNPGTYQVSISDQFGCSISKTYQITEPLPVVANVISTKNILCAGDESGAIDISVSGGTSSLPYKFEWKRNGNPIPANSQNLSGIPAGTYEVKISDANGCFKILSGIQLTEPAAALVINYKKTDISCYGANDGALDLDVSGGQPPYTISWSFGSSQSSFNNLGPGDYTLTVADQSGCTRTQTITIVDAPLFETTPEVKQISCFGKKDGSIKLNLKGGVGKTTIRWDHGAELENLFNLSSGFYGVTVRDETDCIIRSEFNIVEPALLQIEPKVTDALDCINTQSGEISLGITGGTPPYSILWSNGSTNDVLTGITSGQYAVTVNDASGCSINQSFEIKRPPTLSIVGFRSTNVQCNPRSIEEKVQITVTGGVAPYTIKWSGGNISPDGKTMITDSPGLYEVVVTDGKGCIKKESFEVESLEVIPKAEIESAAFEQYNSYLVNFEIQFWNKSFGQITSYFWDFGDGSESFEENPKHTYTAEGEYEVTLKVTDIFGCASEVKKKISVFDYYLVVPNVFTPNGDGINDYFFPKFINIESLEFWVLNKWGETVFYTDDLNSQGWNGKINQAVGLPGNYVYKLKFKTLDGRTQTQTDLFLLLK